MIGMAFSLAWSVLQLWFVLVVAFVSVMHAKAILDRGEEIHWAFLAPLLILGVIGWVADFVFNVTVAWVLFGDPPAELTLTSRLKRYKREWSPDSRQYRWAVWFCDQANKFDRGHC
jgi:ABC-type iron transport system FetAB permease component